jgi:flavorubredoxin
MTIEYFHASKYGNGAMVAEEFTKQLAAKGVTVNVHHIQQARPDRLPTADLYLFSSPGRMGKPIGGMRRFLKKLRLPAGSRYAILTTGRHRSRTRGPGGSQPKTSWPSGSVSARS